jgi:AcrR family transcriptional regulator
MPSNRSKLPAADRKQSILAAAAPVFARLGRAGATTKEIAEAAGISEALLYRHFSGKDALYTELENHCVEASAVGHSLLDREMPSTSTLVIGVSVLVRAVFTGIGEQRSHENTKRLVTNSLLSDGRFAKIFLEKHVKPWIDFFEKSLQAARKAGDLEDGANTGMAEVWFVHHLAHTLHLVSLAESQVIEYNMTQEQLAERATRFLLRGLGLRNKAIDRYYDQEKINNAIKQQIKD